MEEFNYNNILKCWDIDFLRIEKEINIYGSPERSDFRAVVSDIFESMYILEKISPNLINRKEEIAENIYKLKKQNEKLKIHPYLINKDSSFVTLVGDSYWLISPYIIGEELSRPEYLEEDWRGNEMGDFLIELKKAEKALESDSNNIFALDKYVIEIEEHMKKFNSSEYLQLKNVIDYLKSDFFQIYSKLPTSFCHGDYHPINIIWGKKNINAVIDWEFSGYKPELYDTANMVGCLGMENPKTLKKKIVRFFLDNIFSNLSISDISKDHFLNLIISIRFGWLSEWFRKKDCEMLDLEINYINLLNDKKIELMKIWKI